MTKNRHQELRIDITYKDNTKEFEKYSNFSLGAPQQYVLHASGASGTAGTSISVLKPYSSSNLRCIYLLRQSHYT